MQSKAAMDEDTKKIVAAFLLASGKPRRRVLKFTTSLILSGAKDPCNLSATAECIGPSLRSG